MIAGFEQPDAGRITLGGEDITRRPPYARDVNTVFQDYALFPHMTVADNVGYGLKVKGVAARRRGARRSSEVLRMVRLDGYGGRKPVQLSGGQRQRVALARSIVNQPKVLLLDEPLGALDLKLRQEMQVFLKALQQRPRHDLPLRHARPGGGADDERPRRRLQRGPHRAGRRARRDLRAARDRVRRRLRRHVEHPRARRPPLQRPAGADRAERPRRSRNRRRRRLRRRVHALSSSTRSRRATDRRAPERRHARSSPAPRCTLALARRGRLRDQVQPPEQPLEQEAR